MVDVASKSTDQYHSGFHVYNTWNFGISAIMTHLR